MLALRRANLAFLLLIPARATAEEAPVADRPAAPSSLSNPDSDVPPPLPRYHHSVFSLENSLTAQTVGLGADPQTKNPTYEMGLLARPRYYVYEKPGEALSTRAEFGLYRELTNSDSTTRRGEFSLSDMDLALVYSRRFAGRADTDGTFFEVRPITLSLPTSRASFASGRYFALGGLVGLFNVSPLLQGRAKPEILSTVRFAVGYSHWFARATVPTNDELDRVRLTPDGRSSPGDQLSGGSLVQHQISLSGRFRLAFGEAVLWTTDAIFQPVFKYALEDEVELCGVVATGCTEVVVSETDTRYSVRTQFNSELSFRITAGFSLDFGYGNVAEQIGADGRRRSFFYSPDARVYAAISFVPHELAPPPQRAVAAQRASARF